MLGALIVGAVSASLLLLRGAGTNGSDRTAGAPTDRWRSPATALAVVIGLIYVNQVLFTVYVVREHGGDPSFVARHVPDGWFSLAHGPVIEWLARSFPAPGLLTPSVLRVNAVLEQPFVVLAYLTVCRWFSPWVYERALGLVWPMSLSCTVVFCLVEWRLHNQYTVDDIVLRSLVALVVPLAVTRLSTTAAPGRSDSVPGLLVFVASVAGLGAACLVVYDTALLYNLGHLDEQLPFAGVAVLVAVAARAAARRVPDRPPGPGVGSIAAATGWLLVLFMVPALPIRYGLGFGTPWLSVAGAALLVAVAAELGRREAFARAAVPGGLGRWLLQMVVAGIAGLCGAAIGLLVDAGHTETRLLVAGAAGSLAALSVCALLDRIDRRSRFVHANGGILMPRFRGRS